MYDLIGMKILREHLGLKVILGKYLVHEKGKKNRAMWPATFVWAKGHMDGYNM